MRQFVNTTHTIFAATDPALYKLFSFDPKIVSFNLRNFFFTKCTLKAKQRNMYMAGFLTIERNEHAIKIIDKWVICAKAKFCMAPLNSKLECDGSKLWSGEYGGCHRYDQSALAILLVQNCGNCSNYFRESSLIYPKLF